MACVKVSDHCQIVGLKELLSRFNVGVSIAKKEVHRHVYVIQLSVNARCVGPGCSLLMVIGVCSVESLGSELINNWHMGVLFGIFIQISCQDVECFFFIIDVSINVLDDFVLGCFIRVVSRSIYTN